MEQHEGGGTSEDRWVPICNRCASPFTRPGATVLEPPDDAGRCHKIHICVRCWIGLRSWLTPMSEL